MNKELTKKQKKLLKFYIYNWKEVPPTYQEMASFMGVGSKQSIVDMIRLIEKKLGSVVSIRRSTLRNQRGASANLAAPPTRFEQQEFLGIDNYGESSQKSIL